MAKWYEKAVKAADFLKKSIEEQLGFLPNPEVALILGTCFGEAVNFSEEKAIISYNEIPEYTVSTVNGHSGKLICCKIGEVWCYVMQGRTHYYEGYETDEVVLPIRVFSLLGVKNLIVTNAAGGINTSYKVGDFVAISDHLSFFAPSPIRGVNEEYFGLRFPSMDNAYDTELREKALNCASETNITMHIGVYAYMRGPQFETPAEIKALRILGGDLAGMSTVPEVIAARHCGIKVAGFSCVTNMAAGVTEKAVSHEDVSDTENQVKEIFAPFIEKFIQMI